MKTPRSGARGNPFAASAHCVRAWSAQSRGPRDALCIQFTRGRELTIEPLKITLKQTMTHISGHLFNARSQVLTMLSFRRHKPSWRSILSLQCTCGRVCDIQVYCPAPCSLAMASRKVRRDRAVRPFFPITFPMSCLAVLSSSTVPGFPEDMGVTSTAPGCETMALTVTARSAHI
jgi:hypothetical protein